MALQLTDNFVIERSGVHYKTTGQTVADTVAAAIIVDTLASTSTATALSANQGKVLNDKIDALGTVEHQAADITARDALTGLVSGDRVFVVDASADGTVTAGWAIYRWDGSAFLKMAEQESLDVGLVANLSYTASPTDGTVTIDTGGTSATLSLATAVNAGLLAPADFSNLHIPATTAGSAATNPIVITGQDLSFDIAGLTAAP